MENFSKQLVDRLIRYMQTQHGVTLSPEEANEYLRVYADAFMAFTGESGEGDSASLMRARRPRR